MGAASTTTRNPLSASDPLFGLVQSGAPVLIFELDAGGVEQPKAPAQRWEMRLVSCGCHGRRAQQHESGGGASAVLYLRALTPSRLLACVRELMHGGAGISLELLRQMLPGHESEIAGPQPAKPEAAIANGRNQPLRIVNPDIPALIFELDAAGIDQPEAAVRRSTMRLVGCVRDRRRGQRADSCDGVVSAVLYVRALTPARLLACVRKVTSGGVAISPELLCQAFPVRAGDVIDGQPKPLTDRELDVLRLLAAGENTREIAEQISYSERTVKNIVHELLVKLDCRTRAHAVGLATRQGVI